MSAFEQLHLSGAAAAVLAADGWSADDPVVKDSAAPVARGQNLLFLAPPSPAWATPVLAGAASRLASADFMLLLAPAESVEAWGSVATQAMAGSPVQVHVGRGEARAVRMLKDGRAGLLVASPEMALALVRRSALKLEAVTAVLLAWPEQLGDEPLSTLMQDVPRDAQRLIVSTSPAAGERLAERYARRALAAGPLAGPSSQSIASGTVRSAQCAWRLRAEAAAQVIELLDPDHPAVWAVDRSAAAALRQQVPEHVAPLVTDPADVEAATLIVAWDAPTAGQLAQLASTAEVVLLCPPGTEAWPAQVASRIRPLRLPGFQDDVLSRHASRRAEIARAIDEAALDDAVHALAPLLERFEGSRVAAALYHLWTAKSPEPPPTSAGSTTSATARIWVGVGLRDKATPGDLMAALVKEVGVDRSQIGKIDVKESFTLVELPSTEAGRIAERLSGVEIRRRRVVARLDRGAERPAARGPRRGA